MIRQLKTALRILLGISLLYPGIGHLSFAKDKFALVVPSYLQWSEGFVDFIVISSGIAEIAFALGLLLWTKEQKRIGAALAIFFVLIFPGNIHQYLHHIDIPPLLASEEARFIRLFFQPVFIAWALWCTNGTNTLLSWIGIKREKTSHS